MAVVESSFEEPDILEDVEKDGVTFLEGDYFGEAYSVLDEERERSREEIRLFRGFWEELKDMPVETRAYTPVGKALDSEELESVYDRKVFGSDTYFREEFRELEESFRNEFGDEALRILESGSNLDDSDKRTIKKCHESAVERREDMLQIVESERNYLEGLEENLEELSNLEEVEFWRRSRDEVREFIEYTSEAREYIENVLEERQRKINSNPDETHGTLSYLYDDASLNYPVLRIAAETLDYLEDVREELYGQLT